MATARWDFVWQQGGSWRRKLRRLDGKGRSLGITGPCRIELRKIDDTDDRPAVETVDAVVDPGHDFAMLDVSEEVIRRHGGKRYQHKVIATDPDTNRPDVIARGYVTVVNRAGS